MVTRTLSANHILSQLPKGHTLVQIFETAGNNDSCTVWTASMKLLVDCSLCRDSSVRGFSTIVRYLDSWQVGEPQNKTMGRVCMLGLCNLGKPYSLCGCGTCTTVGCNVDHVSFLNLKLFAIKFSLKCWRRVSFKCLVGRCRDFVQCRYEIREGIIKVDIFQGVSPSKRYN